MKWQCEKNINEKARGTREKDMQKKQQLMSQGHLNNITVYPNSAVCKWKDSGT